MRCAPRVRLTRASPATCGHAQPAARPRNPRARPAREGPGGGACCGSRCEEGDKSVTPPTMELEGKKQKHPDLDKK